MPMGVLPPCIQYVIFEDTPTLYCVIHWGTAELNVANTWLGWAVTTKFRLKLSLWLVAGGTVYVLILIRILRQG